MNKIICGDAIEEMKKLTKGSVDLVATDPPYGIDYDDWDKLNTEWIKEAFRILKDNGSIWVFCGWSNVIEVREELKKYFIERNWIIWDRQKGRGAKYNLVSTREDILWFSKSDNYTFNKTSSTIKKKTKGLGLKNGDQFRKLSNVWTDISPIVPWSKEKVKHSAQKPLSIMERIIKISSNEKDLVLDPFAGSFTTAIASENLKRNWICIEKENNYCEIGRKRVEENRQRLFNND
jgi:site-specific DNA-methyltransferase (adenine-specific)